MRVLQHGPGIALGGANIGVRKRLIRLRLRWYNQQQMRIDAEICYRALKTRDVRFDGRFFTGVASTGVFCRPICPAPTPKRENCRFFPSAAAALAAKYRPCLRCRPETSPGTPAWNGSAAVVGRALRLIEAGCLAGGAVEDLAERVGIGARQLRRLFLANLGASPAALERARRILLSKKLLDETSLPVTGIAHAAGFSSVRRFHTVFRATYGRPPRDIRRGKAAAERGGPLELRLAYRPPYDWSAFLRFLAPRAIPHVEQATSDGYARSIRVGPDTGLLAIAPQPGDNAFRITLDGVAPQQLNETVQRARRLLDLTADPEAVGSHLARAGFPRLAPGLRVPGAWDRFELAVRAVLGQQITVRAASTLAGRLVRAFGRPLDSHDGFYVFPAPGDLAEADLETIGLPRSRAQTLRFLASAAATGALDWDRLDSAQVVAALEGIRGIGPWTAQYIAMRALGDPDAFPASDLGLRQAWGRLAGHLPTPKELTAEAEAWRPWRSYAAMQLWMMEAIDETSSVR